jgi:hypothetical protein
MNVSDQRLAVARLTTYCEIIITRGLLPMDKETALRALVNSTCNAFDMESVAERGVVEQSDVHHYPATT